MTGILHDTLVAPVAVPRHRKPDPVSPGSIARAVVHHAVQAVDEHLLPHIRGTFYGLGLAIVALAAEAAYVDAFGPRPGVVFAMEIVVVYLGGVLIGTWLCRRIDTKAARRLRVVRARRNLHAIRALTTVKVTTDQDFGVAECLMCDLDGLPAAVRVYGEPAARHQNPVELAEVCAEHALSVIQRAVSEQDEQSRHPIRVEVAA